MTTPNTAAAALNEAARLIEVHGWVQGRDGNSIDGWSLWGAVCQVAARDGARRYRMFCALESCLGGTRNGLAAWNDFPTRTAAEVIALLRAAAKVAEETA